MLELTLILCHAGSQGLWTTITLTTDEDAPMWDEPALIDLIDEKLGPGTIGEDVIHVAILHYEEVDEDEETKDEIHA